MPPRTFFLCATPRSGSSFLSRLMAQTGLFGDLREHFHAFDLAQARRVGGLAPDASALEIVQHVMDVERSPEGLFSVKVMWEQLGPLLKASEKSVPDLFPGLVCANLTREGTLRQAISLTKAKMQGRWHSEQALGMIEEPPFDPWQIENELRVLESNARCWQEFYEREGIEPLVLTFEQVVEDPKGAIAALVKLCGLTYDVNMLGSTSEQRRMSDGINVRWEHAYLQLDEAGADFDREKKKVSVEEVSVKLTVSQEVVLRPRTPSLVRVELTNTGTQAWPVEGGRNGRDRIVLEGRWVGLEGIVFPTRAYVLRSPAPGETRTQEILLSTPAEMGEYTLEFGLLQMGGDPIGDSIQVTAAVRPRVSPEEEERIAELFPDSELHADGWYWSSWLGYFSPAGGEWIVHQGFGWTMARLGPEPEEGKKRGYNFWNEEHGWFWTSEEAFPWINRFDKGGWHEIRF